MMTIRIGFFILFGVLPGGLAFAQVGDGQEGFRRGYSILLERNIFSRDRRPYRPERERSTTQAPPPPIESTLVLLGIGRQQGQTLAFVEDTLTGRIERHAVGSSIARGHVRSLTLDFLVYARDSKEAVSDPNAPAAGETARVNPPSRLTKVWIGQTLMGETSAGSPSFSTTSTGTGAEFFATPTTGASQGAEGSTTPSGDGDQSDILKRLLERRRQELGN